MIFDIFSPGCWPFQSSAGGSSLAQERRGKSAQVSSTLSGPPQLQTIWVHSAGLKHTATFRGRIRGFMIGVIPTTKDPTKSDLQICRLPWYHNHLSGPDGTPQHHAKGKWRPLFWFKSIVCPGSWNETRFSLTNLVSWKTFSLGRFGGTGYKRKITGSAIRRFEFHFTSRVSLSQSLNFPERNFFLPVKWHNHKLTVLLGKSNRKHTWNHIANFKLLYTYFFLLSLHVLYSSS